LKQKESKGAEKKGFNNRLKTHPVPTVTGKKKKKIGVK